MSRPRRIPNYPYTGVQRYFLTICTDNRAEFFREAETVQLAVDQFLYTSREQGMAIVVYLLMPDHAHLLVDGEFDDSDLKQFVKLSKQRSSYRFKKRFKRKLLQDGYSREELLFSIGLRRT